MPPETFLRGRARRSPPTAAATAPPAGSTRSAGPTTRSACSTSAARRSSSCCWATWAARAAASWRCAVTPASRARPTSRRCTTSCRATCRCPRPASTTPCDDYLDSDRQHRAEGLLGQRRRLRRQPAQVLLGRRGHRGERLRLRLPAAADRRPRHLPDRDGHAATTRSRATSCSARTRRSARRTGGCSGSAMAHLKWLVVRDLNLIESATFWKDAPGDRDRRAARPRTSAPRCSSSPPPRTWRRTARSPRPSGCCSGTTRRSSRRATAAASCSSSSTSAARSASGSPAPPTSATGRCSTSTWDYPVDEHGDPSAEAVLQEINGFHLTGDKAGQPLSSLHRDEGRRLDRPAAAGSTPASTPTGSTRPPGASPGREQSWVAPEWGWAWPTNRRILYNRASADPEGKPWSERKAYVWWDEEQRQVDRPRRPGLRGRQAARRTGPSRAPAARRARRRRPVHHAGRRQGLALRADRAARRAAADALRAAGVAGAQPALPPAGQPDPAGVPAQGQPTRTPRGDEPGAEVFPYVFTTYRLTEHHTAGGMSRWLPYLSELQPEFFCEVSPELAARARAGATAAGRRSSRARTAIEARVLVTERMSPLTVGGRHDPPGRAALPLGGRRRRRSSPATRPTTCSGSTLDPNVHIQESKVASCDIRPGRRPDGPGAAAPRRRLPQPEPASPSTTGNAQRTRPHQDAPALPKESIDEHPVVRFDRPGPRRRLGGPAGRARASSPTPRSASAARRARWPARSGTRSPRTASTCSARSYDNTGALGASTWRHVAFIEQSKPLGRQQSGVGRPTVDLGMPSVAPPAGPDARRLHGHRRRRGERQRADAGRRAARLPLADVLRRVQALHHAACLDVCPTGSLFRTEFGTVVVQDDICNGCGYCVPACPFGVIERRIGDPRAPRTSASPRSAPCATTGSAPGRPPPAPRPARPSRSSSATWTSCASGPRPASGAAARRRGAPTRGCTARTPTTASAAPARCSCCSTSRRSTACPRTRSSPPRDLPHMWRRAAWLPAPCSSAPSPCSPGAGHEPRRGPRRAGRAPPRPRGGARQRRGSRDRTRERWP